MKSSKLRQARRIGTLIFCILAACDTGGFEFQADIAIDPTVGSVTFQGRPVNAGFHFDQTYDTFMSASDSRESVFSVTHGSQSGIAYLAPHCNEMYGAPDSESDQLVLLWNTMGAYPLVNGSGTCHAGDHVSTWFE